MFDFSIDVKNKKLLFNSLFYIVLVFFIFLSIIRIFNSINAIIDTYEHIHVSWLVSEGLVPYRDFFEHHNPLLWYLFAPITKLFYRDANIVYVARIIAVIGYFITLFSLYYTSFKYCKSKLGAQFSVIFILFFSCFWKDIQNIRPDIFMYISMLWAVLLTFKYLDTQKTKYLSYSYLLWFIAFLFLQKALIFGLGFAIANLYLVYRKDIKFKDVIIASILPLSLSSLLLVIAYKYNVLENWYVFNFEFNVIAKNNVGNYYSGINPQRMRLISILLSFIIIRNFKYSSKSIILLTMYLAGFIQILYFAPFPHYYLFSFIITAILLSKIFIKLYNKNYFATCVICVILLSNSFFVLYKSSQNRNYIKNEVKLIEYTIKNTSPEEKLLGGDRCYILFNHHSNFHWFGFYGIALLADLYLDFDFNYNKEIKKHKPKLLFFNNYPLDLTLAHNSYHIRMRNHALLRKASKGDLSYLDKMSNINLDYWNIDMDFIKENYEYIKTFNNTEVWKRIDK